jgi:hypothetical protein
MATSSVGPASAEARRSSKLVTGRKTVRWWAAADLAAKSGLAVFLVLVVLDPDWGNMAGKAPVARAVTYPLWSLTVPIVWFLTGGNVTPFRGYPTPSSRSRASPTSSATAWTSTTAGCGSTTGCTS